MWISGLKPLLEYLFLFFPFLCSPAMGIPYFSFSVCAILLQTIEYFFHCCTMLWINLPRNTSKRMVSDSMDQTVLPGRWIDLARLLKFMRLASYYRRFLGIELLKMKWNLLWEMRCSVSNKLLSFFVHLGIKRLTHVVDLLQKLKFCWREPRSIVLYRFKGEIITIRDWNSY